MLLLGVQTHITTLACFLTTQLYTSFVTLAWFPAIYPPDTYNSVVRIVYAQTAIIATFAGTGRAGYSGDYGAYTS